MIRTILYLLAMIILFFIEQLQPILGIRSMTRAGIGLNWTLKEKTPRALIPCSLDLYLVSCDTDIRLEMFAVSVMPTPHASQSLPSGS